MWKKVAVRKRNVALGYIPLLIQYQIFGILSWPLKEWQLVPILVSTSGNFWSLRSVPSTEYLCIHTRIDWVSITRYKTITRCSVLYVLRCIISLLDYILPQICLGLCLYFQQAYAGAFISGYSNSRFDVSTLLPKNVAFQEIITQVFQHNFSHTEMWCYERILKIKWTDTVK